MCFPTFLTLNVTFFKEILITGGRIDLSLQMNLVLEVSNFNYAYLVKSVLVKKKKKVHGSIILLGLHLYTSMLTSTSW